MRSVALDLGKKAIAYCEVKDDAVVRRTTVGSLETLEPLLGPGQPAARVAIEACREAWFVHRKLTDWGNEVLLVDTTRCKEILLARAPGRSSTMGARGGARAARACARQGKTGSIRVRCGFAGWQARASPHSGF